MKNFWQNLEKPFFVLAPMADVTDAAFRRIIAKYGKPDVLWTEFVSADGLVLGGYERLKNDFIYTEAERPIVAQIFGSNPETIEKASKIVLNLSFDGLDINMGCPDRNVEKQGAGATLIKNPALAREIIKAAKRGVKNKIPVSVKTRIGYNKNEIETWLPELLAENPAVVSIHARTRKEMSKVPADWSVIKRAVEIRNDLGSEALIIGNGDVLDLEDAREKVRETGCDGVMLGKAIFGNPWLFAKNKKEISVEEKLEVMFEHTKAFEELLIPHKNFAVMKKHYKAYLDGLPGAKELRVKCMEAKDASEVEQIVREFARTLQA